MGSRVGQKSGAWTNASLRNSHLITTSTDGLAQQISVMFKGKIRMCATGINQQREKQGVQLDKIQVVDSLLLGQERTFY